ncbi:hypothetical protein EVAR_4155_1 [Eumeta japonica]|uniref:Uncharacterized protein n=1 Tax=Eumeta variegata TaxID=151549 RepID=A0A4C1TFW8_EUMVA|nr:hypothetical protein EVAR_4155_1 [Eumeta japonica]
MLAFRAPASMGAPGLRPVCLMEETELRGGLKIQATHSEIKLVWESRQPSERLRPEGPHAYETLADICACRIILPRAQWCGNLSELSLQLSQLWPLRLSHKCISVVRRHYSQMKCTAAPRVLSSNNVSKLGEGGACNHTSDSKVRTALSLALLLASGPPFNSR